MIQRFRALVLVVVAAFAGLALAACSETTDPARSNPVLDDLATDDWQAVSVGADHTCGLKANGGVYCWGSNRYGQLGVASVDTMCGPQKGRFPCAMQPQRVQADAGIQFMAVSAGAEHSCAITVARDVYCWGLNDQGQVGPFTNGGSTPYKIPATLGWSQISAGYSHTCAVRTDGTLFCWGANDRGQLGAGNFGTSSSLVRVPINSPVAWVSTGQQRTCARTNVGTVYCWGAIWIAREGGLEMTRAQASPQLVPAAPNLASLSVGSFTTCGSDTSGSAYCWEANPRGEMGTGTQDGSTTPQRVATNLSFLTLSAGIVQTCGVAANGAGYCWGDDSFGQLGVASSALLERCGGQQLPCSTTPVPVFGRQQFSDISTGFGSHACGVTIRGNLYCWGLGVSGQRGDGTASYTVSVPIMVREPKT